MARFFALVCGLRYAVDQDEPVPFACRWVAEHLGLATPMAAQRARKRLVEAGVLTHVGSMPRRSYPRGTDLCEPFERAPLRIEVNDRIAVEPIVEVPAQHVMVTAETFGG